MKTLYGLSWRLFHRCDCVGPKQGLHPIAVHGKQSDPAPVFARVDRLSLSTPSCWLAWVWRWSTGLPAALSGRGRRRARPCFRLRNRITFFHAQISCFDVPIAVMALLWRGPTEVFALAPLGHSVRRLLWLRPGHQTNAWLIPCFLVVHYCGCAE